MMPIYAVEIVVVDDQQRIRIIVDKLAKDTRGRDEGNDSNRSMYFKGQGDEARFLSISL